MSTDDIDILSIDELIPIDSKNSRSQMKKIQRKKAKMEQRKLAKLHKVVPFVAKIISDTAIMIEQQLKAQVKLSNIKYNVFAEDSDCVLY